jgi:hypothetical protein
MRKKRTLLICAVCALLALLALLAYKPASREPSYDGHPLSHWVGILGRIPPRLVGDQIDPYREAANAIDQIGVAGVPFLVKSIQGSPPRWKFQLYTWFARAHLPFANRLGDSMARASQLAEGSRLAFQVLGEKAMPALNDLCRLMNETNTPSTSYAAITALSRFGTNAVPALLAVGANTNHLFHIQAQFTAAQILNGHPPPAPFLDQ